MRFHLPVALALLSILGGIAPVSSRADESEPQLRALVERYAPSIAFVRAVIKVETMRSGGSREREQRAQMLGVVVDPKGLIVVQGRQFANEGSSRKLTPVDIKVIFSGEEKEYDAFLAALDSKLGLAFLQVDGLGDRVLPAVDFAQAVDPRPGQQVAAIGRLPKTFDYVPFFETARVAAEIQKPRRAWILEGSFSGFGLPVFAFTGEVVGVLSMVVGSPEEDSGGMMGRQIRAIFPGAVMKSVIEQARKQAAAVAEERAKQAAEGKTGTPVPVPGDAPKDGEAPKDGPGDAPKDGPGDGHE